MLAGLAAANVVLNRMVPADRLHEIPAHLATTGAFSALAWDSHSPSGLHESLTHNPRSGITAGLGVGLPIGIGIALAAFVPVTRRFFHDERIAGADSDTATYHLFARIPIATALCEEVIFRGAIPAVLRRRRSTLETEIIASALFGLWHVLPSYDRMHTNPGTAAMHQGDAGRQVAVIGGTVGATAVAGFALAKLRDFSGSIIAPVLVHAAINGGGFFGGWLSSRFGPRMMDQHEPTTDGRAAARELPFV